MSKFTEALANYFGLAEVELAATEVFSKEGAMHVAFEIRLSDEDVLAVAKRMEQMQAAESEPAPAVEVPAMPTPEQMRTEYDGLDQVARGRFGSFARYVGWRTSPEGMGTEEQFAAIPAHVYLPKAECSDLQQVMALGRDQHGKYAVAIEDLTPAQRARYVQPTSNADDFGGAPG